MIYKEKTTEQTKQINKYINDFITGSVMRSRISILRACNDKEQRMLLIIAYKKMIKSFERMHRVKKRDSHNFHNPYMTYLYEFRHHIRMISRLENEKGDN